MKTTSKTSSLLFMITFISIWAVSCESKKSAANQNNNNHPTNDKKVELQSTQVTNSNNNNNSVPNNVYASVDDLAPAEKTLSPYFIVLSDDPSHEQLPLKSTSANVNIAGVIADVEITQVYKNTGTGILEAIYTFPASSRAAVYSMEMYIGKRKIVATIKEKQQARIDYEQAQENGNRAALLEESRPNVFQMNVANISPGDEIKVCLKYTELLVPEEGTYQFVYPTVVGPRYSSKTEHGGTHSDEYVETPYLHEGELPTYDFDIQAHIAAGMDIKDVTCTTHKVKTSFPETKTANVRLDSAERRSGNKDFVLEYKLAGNKIETGLLLYEHGDEKFFLMMVQPPKAIKPQDIPPREYVFIMDVSGSMSGWPLEVSKKLLRNLITNLRPTDKFNVTIFASAPELMSPISLDANTDNINKAMTFIDQQTANGGTELLPGLKKSFALPRESASLSRSFVVLTDGYVDVEKECFSLIRGNLNNANLFAVGIGGSVNHYLIEGMAHAGMGEPLIVMDEKNSDQQCERFRQYISSPVLTQVKRDFGTFQAYDIEPLTSADVLAERPVIIFGKYKGEAKGTIKISGYNGINKYTTSFDVSSVKADSKNMALRYLWARERIKFLEEDNAYSFSEYLVDSAKVKEVTKLGLKYNLLTAHTSFVAIDKTEVIDQNGKKTLVQQVLPLPENVSNYAIGADFGIDEETAEYNMEEFSIYSEIILSPAPVEPQNKVVIANLENKLGKLVNAALASVDLMGCDSITVTVDGYGVVKKVSVCGDVISSSSKYDIEQLFFTYNFSFPSLNQEWCFIIKF